MLTIKGDSLDQILRDVYTSLLSEGQHLTGPTKGPNSEAIGVTLELSNPRARLSRSYSRGRAFSAIGELAWYLAGSDDPEFIHHYLSSQPYKGMDKDGVLRGAYGPRLMGEGRNDQIQRVIDLLKEKPTSRQAVIQLFDRQDLADGIADLPCTCTVQFLVRNGKLDTVTFMRSNDAYLGIPHDFFCFTMLQELVARSLNVEVGRYIHMVGSLHLYDKHADEARSYLAEGFHPPTKSSMPWMPAQDPWPDVRAFVETESRIRGGEFTTEEMTSLGTGYWDDLIRMVIGKSLSPANTADLQFLEDTLGNSYFAPYLSDRQHSQ
jgi:thymidylate synthase